jgi:hypothetical protein
MASPGAGAGASGASDAPWTCKLLATGGGEELLVYFAWRGDAFDVQAVDAGQRVWSKQGAACARCVARCCPRCARCAACPRARRAA